MANEKELKKETEKVIEEKAKLEPQFSPLVSEIIEMLGGLGLKPVPRKGYVAFKIGHRNILALTRTQASSVDKLCKFIFTRERSDFPKEILSKISGEIHGGFYYAVVSSAQELGDMLKIYLKQFEEK